MLQLRPTFSESWYRVVGLKPKLRGTAQISRQYYRGERWYVVRDAASNQFHRLSDAAYRFVGLLDGSRTVGDAWDLVGGQLADDAPTQPEVIQILSQLYAANLVETDIPPDATVLLRRHKKQMQRKLQGRMMNVLFPRIPIWDPDRFLCRWMPLARVAFSRLGAIIWMIAVGTAIFALSPHWADLRQAAQDAVNIRQNPENAVYLWLVFVLIKFIHECGHAFSCRRFGGEVHEMGIMFLVFVPTPYVDASTAWAFPNKWARMFVGAAGMIVELFVASICAFIWLATKDSNSLVTHLAYNAMLIASVTTVVFNANPLLRYDGYYMLSDYWEMPNLQMKSREYLMGLIKRHVFRIKATQPLPPPWQRTLLGVYGVFSTVYRIFVGITIILVVTWQIPILGVLMGLGGVITWLVVPVVKLFKYLTIEPELHRKRGRAWAFCGAVAGLAALLIGIVRFPMSVYADGIVEPEHKDVLHVETPGFVKEIHAHDGDFLHKGDVILVLEDPELEAEIKQNEADVESSRIKVQNAAIKDGGNAVLYEQAALEIRRGKLADSVRREGELTITAGIDGSLIAPDLRNLQGKYLARGFEVGTVATMDLLKVRAAFEQRDAELVFEPGKHTIEIRLVSQPGVVLYPLSFTPVPGAQTELPHPRLSNAGGGGIPLDPKDKTGKTPETPDFEAWATIANPDSVYYPGQGAYVRVRLDNASMLRQWTRRFLQLVRNRSNTKWL